MMSCRKYKDFKTSKHVEKNTVASLYARSNKFAPECDCAHLEVSDAPPAFLHNNTLLRHCGQDLQSSDLHNVVLLFEIAGRARNDNMAHNDHYIHLAGLPVSRKSSIYPTKTLQKPDQAPTSTTGTSQHTNIDICEHDSILGTSLSNSYAQANAAFNSKVYYANGVDYTSQAAINSISYISQAEANYYINQGAALAYSQGSTWGCVPGAYTNMAVNMYATDVNRRKDSANSQIYNIKQNKQAAHDAYVAYLAYLEWLEKQRALAQSMMLNDLMLAQLTRGITGSAGKQTGLGKGGGYKTKRGGATGGAGASSSGLGLSMPDNYSLSSTVTQSTMGLVFDAGVLEENIGAASKLTKFAKVLPWAGVAIDTGYGVYENIQSGASPKEIIVDASVDVAFGVGGIAVTAAAGAAIGSALPGVGTAVGAIVGVGIGLGIFFFVDVVSNDGVTFTDWTKNQLNSIF